MIKFFQFSPGDDAPELSHIRIAGKKASYSLIEKHLFGVDDEVEVSLASDVAFARCPGIDCLFSERLGGLLDLLRPHGRLVRVKGDKCASMYAFFPAELNLFDESSMGVVYSNAIAGAVVGYKSIAFNASVSGQEIGRSLSKGVLSGCFFSECFARRVSESAFTRGFYLRAWKKGEARPFLLTAAFGRFKPGDERRTMRV